jgi:hypothetical protein
VIEPSVFTTTTPCAGGVEMTTLAGSMTVPVPGASFARMA